MDYNLPGSSEVSMGFPGPWRFPSKTTRMGSHFLLRGVFLTQGLNPHFLHWKEIFLLRSHQGNPHSCLHQTKRLWHSKRNDQKTGKPAYGIGNNILNQISGKDLLSKVYKELVHYNTKKIIQLLMDKGPE